MPITGLVIVCGGEANGTLRALRDSGMCTVGDVHDASRIPVVLETSTDVEHRAQLRWIERLPGVSMVELVYADYRAFEHDDAETPAEGVTNP